ncbi:recombinase family protein [Frankia sp. AiPs1]|nr:recombinase family protein [Frankia sp. AiPs1]
MIGYVRVSTKGQADDGEGLEVQEKKLRAWCRQEGHRLGEIYREEGVSGKLEDRPKLGAVLEALKNGEAEAVVIPRLDRLARDLIVQETLIREIRRMGTDVFTTVPGEAAFLAEDPSDPSRKLIRQVLGAVSEYERSIITLRLQSGRAHKASKGGYAYGAPAFGQRSEKIVTDTGKTTSVLVANDTEQAALALMTSMHADGASLREIVAALDAAGHKPKHGGDHWHPTTVSRCLARARKAA